MISFRDALLNILDDRGISLRALAEGAGVSYEQLKKLKQNKSKSTNVDDAAKIASYLDMSISELLNGQLEKSDDELVSALSSLSPEVRQFLLKAARAQSANLDPDEK